MTTQHMHHEHNDGDLPAVENHHVSETLASPSSLADASLVEGQAHEQSESSLPQNEEYSHAPTSAIEGEEQKAQRQQQPGESGEDEVRPFTAFIEEFQQSEGYPAVSQPELPAETFAALISEGAPTSETGLDIPASGFDASWSRKVAEKPETGNVPEAVAPVLPVELATASATEIEEMPSTAPAEAAKAQVPTGERPVSPLLRPASRIRMPRHGTRHRGQEAISQEASPTSEPVVEVVAETTAAPVEPPTQGAAGPEQVPAAAVRPPRRYRFDRPATNTYTPAASSPVPAPRTEEYKEVVNRAATPVSPPAQPATQTENEPLGNGYAQGEEHSAEQQPQKQNQPAQQAEVPAAKTSAPGEEAGNGHASTNGEHERRRRHGQERQREKEQNATAITAQANTVAEPEVQPQQAVSPVEPAAQAEAEAVNPEDLPPLEYSELQAASSRRRRRRRPGVGTNGTSAPSAAVKAAATETPAQTPAPTPAPTPTSAAPIVPPRANAASSQYNIVSGYTMNQMNQNGDSGPFMGPEPSPARGSMSTQHGRSVRAEVQRAPAYPAVRETTGASPASVRHLADTVAQAIQAQTDRMVAELRRANQGPTNVSVTLPPFPSTERVGVFVDVANLLYSARTMRINIDFGKLLDFLRGNRRLVRAQAYCPTSPQPGDEQMFLQAVKGLGYRITTKNYKTFSSGAKKADLDLDLCMDVVRLVDGRAVDCIVLVSGDSDFMPMLDYCSDHGVRVEVAAFDEAMSATLRQSCDLFVNLSMLEEIRA